MRHFKSLLLFRQTFSTKPKLTVVPDSQVLNDINNEVYKPKNHPGVVRPKLVILPPDFVKAVVRVTSDFAVKTLIKESESLRKYLKARLPPIEQPKLKETVNNVRNDIIERTKNVEIHNEEEERKYEQTVINKARNILKRTVYNWKPIKYDAKLSLLYLLSMSAAEYAVLSKIMGEIHSRDPEFQPKSLFDFGSGIGTATWAAINYWKEFIFEYYNVDISKDMNDLAEHLLKGGSQTGNMDIHGVFYRQFLPASRQIYDIVICAYSLFELPSARARLETILNLWNKTGKYLIVVEHGTNAGFKLVNEVRDFILQIDKETSVGHVFSPCPHDNVCPRYRLDDGTPCNFLVRYFELPFVNKEKCKEELYSYVILKKGKRPTDDLQWPRIVKPVLVRSKHSICRICTADGNLDELIFTAYRNGKMTYYCARKSEWGDLLPLKIKMDENFRECSNEQPEEIPNT